MYIYIYIKYFIYLIHFLNVYKPKTQASKLQSFNTNNEDAELQSFRASDRFRNHAANPVVYNILYLYLK